MQFRHAIKAAIQMHLILVLDRYSYIFSPTLPELYKNPMQTYYFVVITLLSNCNANYGKITCGRCCDTKLNLTRTKLATT